MSEITKIEDQKNKKRVNIFVDDAFFCGLHKETAVTFGLKIGKIVDISTEGIYSGLKEMMDSPALLQVFTKELSERDFSNQNEINKFYERI